MVKISPSVLAADFTRLGEEVKDIVKGGADMVHLDVMDGAFVTNISFGLPVIESLRKVTDAVFDVHLMIERPERYAKRFIDAGADILTFHYEACEDSEKLLREIRECGAKAAISVKPNTEIEKIYGLLPLCDMVLVMTVEPGYGGQALIPETLDKVEKLRAQINLLGLDIDVQVDGGINAQNASVAVAKGANVLVAGSSVFKAADRKVAIDALRS
jgi:ribulose-phosphate 3-epimerase